METQKIKNLAVSGNGFIFDPSTGHSYTANESCLFLLKRLADGLEMPELIEALVAEYDVEPHVAEQDAVSLIEHLKSHYLI